MAKLEFIEFNPWQISAEGDFFVNNARAKGIVLPQLYWADHSDWAEANAWALSKAVDDECDAATVLSLMRHIKSYADFLESSELDWRHFPLARDERSIVKFRGSLKSKIDVGELHGSTARSRISAVIQFYRFSDRHNLVGSEFPLWKEKRVSIRFVDTTGFKRAIGRSSTDLAIPNRQVQGVTLEDGLLPLSSNAMSELLQYTSVHCTKELHLMLSIGFFTGARVGTVASLTRESIVRARPDPLIKGIHLLRVGPGTKVSTKHDVKGDLIIPDDLLEDLFLYAESVDRLFRQKKAKSTEKDLIFLTRSGRSYSVNSIDRLVQELRKKVNGTFVFMNNFKFHQTRATFGTWLMRLMLEVTEPAVAVDFVRSAMLHRNEATTFRYIKFLENSKGKERVAQAFSEAFTGIKGRDWNGRES